MTTQPNNLIPFHHDDLDLRVVMRDEEPWFVAADVCSSLGIGNTSMAVDRLDDDERDAISSTDTIGRQQELTVINESGLYSLILGSRKPEAKRFKKWVTSEVLPSIRKTGAYLAPGSVASDMVAAQTALLATKDELIKALKDLNEASSNASMLRNALVEEKSKALSFQVQRNELDQQLTWMEWAQGPMQDEEGLLLKALVAGGMSWAQLSRSHSYRSAGSLARQFKAWEARYEARILEE